MSDGVSVYMTAKPQLPPQADAAKPRYYGYMNGWAHTPPEVEHCRDVLGHQLTRTRDNTRGTVEVCTCKLCGYWYRIDSSG